MFDKPWSKSKIVGGLSALLPAAVAISLAAIGVTALARANPDHWLLGPASWATVMPAAIFVVVVYAVWALLATGRWQPGSRNRVGDSPQSQPQWGSGLQVVVAKPPTEPYEAPSAVPERPGPPTAPLPRPPSVSSNGSS